MESHDEKNTIVIIVAHNYDVKMCGQNFEEKQDVKHSPKGIPPEDVYIKNNHNFATEKCSRHNFNQMNKVCITTFEKYCHHDPCDMIL